MTSPVQKLLIAILQKPHVFSKIELYILVQKPLIYVLHHIRYPINRFEEGGIVPLTGEAIASPVTPNTSPVMVIYLPS